MLEHNIRPARRRGQVSDEAAFGWDGTPGPTTIEGEMAKRMMLAVVGAGIGALCGLIVDYFGAGTPALWAGAAAGAVIPQFVLGPPGK